LLYAHDYPRIPEVAEGQVSVINAARPFQRWLLLPPFRTEPQLFLEPASKPLIWTSLRQLEEVSERGRALFPGSLAQKNRLWREFRNFLRQVRRYDEAAAHVEGTSAALLHYYATLNLAKAELLQTNPNSIVGVNIHHGLSYRPSAAKSMVGDSLIVRNGVFPLLYEKRTGHTLPARTRLPVVRLLANCPEVGQELDSLGLTRATPAGMIHAVVTDLQDLWSLIVLIPNALISEGGISSRLFLRHFEEVAKPINWRDVFAISRRVHGSDIGLYESKQRYPRHATTPDNDLFSDYQAVRNGTWNALRDMLDQSTETFYDAVLAPSLYRTQPRTLFMPPSLARYAVMFYVSSLVRYKPSALDHEARGKEAWLLDSFTRQASLPLLHAALSGIEGKPFRFMESFRT
jgi:hypothetical protein